MKSNRARFRFSIFVILMSMGTVYILPPFFIWWTRLLPVMIPVCAALSLFPTIWSLRTRKMPYLSVSISLYLFMTSLLILLRPDSIPFLSRFFYTGVYIFLMLGVTLIPRLLRLEYITESAARVSQPESIWDFKEFKKVNKTFNFVWTALFFAMALFNLITFRFGLLRLLVISIPPATIFQAWTIQSIFTPRYFTKLVQDEDKVTHNFKDLDDFTVYLPPAYIPWKLEREKLVIHFQLRGEKPLIGYLDFTPENCQWYDGDPDKADLRIKCSGEDWLKVLNKEISSTEALLDGIIIAEGDTSLLNTFFGLFIMKEDVISPQTAGNLQKLPRKGKSITFEYKPYQEKKIKKILFIDGSGRPETMCKSTYLAKQFSNAISEKGVHCEFVSLREMDIKPCCNCYTCWSKTPGTCIYKDDMEKILKKESGADILAFISPLIEGHMTSQLKNYIDRRISLFEPQVIRSSVNSMLVRKKRDLTRSVQGVMVFSATDLPYRDELFYAYSLWWKTYMDFHPRLQLLGEIYLPAADLITLPAFSDWKKRIEKLLGEAANQLVEDKLVSKETLMEISRPVFQPETFRIHNNGLWKNLQGKTDFSDFVPDFTENNS